MKVLDLTGCKNIAKDGLAHVFKLENLEELSLSCCCIYKSHLTYLSNLRKLKVLDLSHAHLITGLVNISQLVKLEKLNLTYCIRIKDDDLADLSNLTKLKVLDLTAIRETVRIRVKYTHKIIYC